VRIRSAEVGAPVATPVRPRSDVHLPGEPAGTPPPVPASTPTPVPAADTPSYVVYVWHDTGKRIRLGGVVRKILEEQTAFGYFVQHDGPLFGWRHALEGATEIAPDYYKLGIKNGGVANVKTIIEAVEHEMPNPPKKPMPPTKSTPPSYPPTYPGKSG